MQRHTHLHYSLSDQFAHIINTYNNSNYSCAFILLLSRTSPGLLQQIANGLRKIDLHDKRYIKSTITRIQDLMEINKKFLYKQNLSIYAQEKQNALQSLIARLNSLKK